MSYFSAVGSPIWIKFRRLVQNDICRLRWYGQVEIEVVLKYGGCLGQFNGMSSQSHVPHCRVLPFGEFNVIIPEPRTTLQGERITSTILKIVFRRILFVFVMQFGLRRAAAFVSSSIHLLLVMSASDLPMRTNKFCSVLFNKTVDWYKQLSI